MRILLLVPCYYASEGVNSFHTVFSGLAKAYVKRGHQVLSIWQERAAEDGRLTIKPFVCPVRLIGGRAPYISPQRARSSFSDLVQIIEPGDFVHYHTAFKPFPGGAVLGRLNHAVWRAARTKEARFVATMQTAFFSPPGVSEAKFVESSFIRETRSVTCVSRFAADIYARSFRSLAGRIRVVPNGFDLEEIAEIQDGPGGVYPKPFVFCLARFLPYKGVDILLTAWHDIQSRLPGVELWLGGRDESGRHRKLAALLGISHRVRFCGDLKLAAARKLIRSSLFFVLPSRSDACPLSALDAMALGKAVVATRTGPADYIEDGVSGVLVEPGKVEPLARAMLSVARDEALRRRLGQRARLSARGWTWDHAAEAYLELAKSPATWTAP